MTSSSLHRCRMQKLNKTFTKRCSNFISSDTLPSRYKPLWLRKTKGTLLTRTPKSTKTCQTWTLPRKRPGFSTSLKNTSKSLGKLPRLLAQLSSNVSWRLLRAKRSNQMKNFWRTPQNTSWRTSGRTQGGSSAQTTSPSFAFERCKKKRCPRNSSKY